MIEYSWLIPIMPVFGFIICLIGGYRVRMGYGQVAIFFMFLSFLISLGSFLDVLAGKTYHASITWAIVGGKEIEFGVLIDSLSGIMVLVVSLLILLIHIYSMGYMVPFIRTNQLSRYFAEMQLFSVGMLGLVIADNLLLMFMFWEIVGLCSYLLIGYFYRKPEAARAAMKAFLVTRAGDVMFLIGIIVLFVYAGTFSLTELFELAPEMDLTILTFAAVMIFGGAVGKSAQFPLHVWLPDAMEGPTTVSALIHAATMVKAGVYLVARNYPLFVLSPDAMTTVAYIGGFTALFAASMALVMVDIKKVIAYSTISQLGYMFLALGAGSIFAGMFHLMNHAFFKALLFLAAGSVINACMTNDIREMGGLRKVMPVTALTMLAGSLALSGIPPFSGFFSKDEVILSAFQRGDMVLTFFGIAAAALTAFYTFRVWFMAFVGDYRGREHPKENPKIMTSVLTILAIFATITGFIKWWFEGYMHHFIETYPHEVLERAEHIGTIQPHLIPNEGLMVATVVIAATSITIAYLGYVKKVFDPASIRNPLRPIHAMLYDKYYMDYLFEEIFGGRIGLYWARATGWIDKYIVDGIVDGIGKTTMYAGGGLRRIQTGNIQIYLSIVVVGLIAILLYFEVV
jgi:NADH-quinone oxidoreductase subunit L